MIESKTRGKGQTEKIAREVWGGFATALRMVEESAGAHGKVVVTISYRDRGVRGVRVRKVEKCDGE